MKGSENPASERALRKVSQAEGSGKSMASWSWHGDWRRRAFEAHVRGQVTQHLEPGGYIWICPVEDNSGTPHFAKGEVKPFVVHGVATDVAGHAAAPTADAAIRLMDYAFSIESALKAGRHAIRVENAGAEPHDFALLKLAPGATIEDVRAWLNPERARRSDNTKEPPPLVTAPDGRSHIEHGMIQQLTID